MGPDGTGASISLTVLDESLYLKNPELGNSSLTCSTWTIAATATMLAQSAYFSNSIVLNKSMPLHYHSLIGSDLVEVQRVLVGRFRDLSFEDADVDDELRLFGTQSFSKTIWRILWMSSTYEKFAWGALSGVCGGLAVYASMRMRTLQSHLQPAARQAITTASLPPPPAASSTLPTAAAPAALRLSQDAQHAASVLRKVAPRMNGASHKGQGGRVGILGGSMEYTGAPYYAGTANPMLHLRTRTHPTFTLYPSERERI